MNGVLEKVKKVVLDLEKEHGSILVFALFLRQEPLGKWDIVISAPWLNSNDMESYQIVGSKIQEILPASELLQFSRVVVLDVSDPVVAFLQNGFSITNGGFQEIATEPLTNRFGFTIKHAFLLRCQKNIPKTED